MKWLVCIVLWLSSFAVARNPESVLRKRHLESRNQCRQLRVEILVSPLVDKNQVRALEIQWEFAPHRPGDWIGLYDTDPLANLPHLPTALWRVPVLEEHGWTKTPILERHIEPRDLGYQTRCLGYYAAYLDQTNQTFGTSYVCLRSAPTWMWSLRPEIGDKRIKSVFIPGTHDSAAYGEYDEYIGDTRVRKYSVTQDETILAQLIYGIRYIDLRVGYYPNNREPWWGNHGFAKLHPLRVIFKDIREFLDNTLEIVLLDVQEFPIGFGDNRDVHRKFVQFLASELGNYVTSPTLSYDSTFNDVWRTGKRLILGYDNRVMVMESSFLWPPVQQKWGNVQEVSDLYSYLSGVLEKPPITAWAAMAELTPTSVGVLLDRLKGLRVAAESVNHNLTQWYNAQDWSSRSNVVAVDFFRGSGIIRAAIEWNKFHGQCKTHP